MQEIEKEKIEKIVGDSHLLEIVHKKNSTEFYLCINDFDESATFYNKLNTHLRNSTHNDQIITNINSNGGYIDEGKIILNALQSSGAYLVNLVQSRAFSMGATLFCIGDTRIVYENSEIMFHSYSNGMYGKGPDLRKQFTHSDEHLNGFILDNTIGLTSEEMDRLLNKGEEFWFGAEEMALRGICTHINIRGNDIEASAYIDILKRTRKEVKKLLKKQGVSYNKKMIPTINSALKYEVDLLEEYLKEKYNERQDILYKIDTLSKSINK